MTTLELTLLTISLIFGLGCVISIAIVRMEAATHQGTIRAQQEQYNAIVVDRRKYAERCAEYHKHLGLVINAVSWLDAVKRDFDEVKKLRKTDSRRVEVEAAKEKALNNLEDVWGPAVEYLNTRTHEREEKGSIDSFYARMSARNK